MYQHRLFTRRITHELTTFVTEDISNGISTHHPTNTGRSLVKRLGCECDIDFPPTEDNLRHVRLLYNSLRYFYDRMDRS